MIPDSLMSAKIFTRETFTQVDSVATSCPSRSSPPTAGCGSSSAAAATGSGKASPPSTRVSNHYFPVPGCRMLHKVTATFLKCGRKLLQQRSPPSSGLSDADVSRTLCYTDQILASHSASLFPHFAHG